MGGRTRCTSCGDGGVGRGAERCCGVGGAAFGLLVGLGLREYGGGVYIPLSIAIYGGLGAGIGVGIDALITSDQMIYDARARSSSAGWRIAPVITRERTGIAVSLGF